MVVGASTACFYPLETEKALDKVINLGFKKAEIFFNTVSELEKPFVTQLKDNAQYNGIEITSVHPFSSNLENGCIFGEYQRRYDDFIDIYKKHCSAAAMLGAKVVVIHGKYAKTKIASSDESYFERFASLIEIGKQEGVMVSQENVNLFKSQSLSFCKSMRNYLGDDFHLVFDVKQAIRAKQDPFEFLKEFKNDIVHLHLSDSNSIKDCLPPGKGDFNFNKMFDILKDTKYPVSSVIEIYSQGLDVEKELKQSKEFFDKL